MTDFPEIHRPTTDPTARPLVLLHGGNVANWMWEPQLAAFTDRLVITPDLPGFGRRAAEHWPGLDAVADGVVANVRAHGVEGPFDLAGLSLGGVTALRVLARHPGDVRSAFVTGVPLTRPGAGVRLAARLQLALWRSPWFWRVLAAGMRLPAEARERYVSHGLSVRRETAEAMFAEVYAGGVPEGLGDYTGPLLAVAGGKEDAVVHRSLTTIREVLPGARLRLAAGMHHVWNVEDVELFNAVLKKWFDGDVDERLARTTDPSGR